MHSTALKTKGKIAALLAAFAVVLGGALSPLMPTAQAEPGNPANVESWEELEAAINSDASEITVTKDLVAKDGKTLNVTRPVTIQGDATIYRDSKASTYEPMFTVSGNGNLTLAGGIKLSGKSATCNGGGTPVKHANWVKHPSNERYWNQETGTSPVEGKRVMLGFAESNRSQPDSGAGIAYIGDKQICSDGSCNGHIMQISKESDVIEQDSNGDWQLKSGLAESKYVFTVTDVDHDQYGAAWFNAADGKVIGRTNQLVGDLAPVIVVDKDNLGLNEGAYKIENESNFKFKMGGLDTDAQKYIIPNNNQNNGGEPDKQDYVVAGARPQVNLGYGWDKTWLWVEEFYWTVDGVTDENGNLKRFDTEEAAVAAAPAGSGECTPDEGCSKITTAMFNGSKDNEKGFFVQVNGGTFNLQDNAELRDLITGPNVSYAAPVVAKGGTVNISGGKITHNSVGYSANNADSGLTANKIGKEKEDGWNETGKIEAYANTETAGAIILTEKSKGVISGGEISGNRGDTGAIVVQGKPDRDRSAGKDAPVENGNATASSLDIQNGTLDNNVGVHHAGAVYSFNGAGVEMSGGKITNNFAWNKGGAVWASEESYASGVWKPAKGTPSNLPVGDASFILKGGEISGNMSVHRGGAIEVMSDHVALIGGQINNNYSRVLGGAVYVEGDGVDRMYQLYIDAGCITGNHAVRDENYNLSAPLYRTLNTATDCDFSNEMNGATAGNVSDRGLGFNKYYGHGGGIWLCPFGGNTTFAVPNSEVIVTGNSADQSSKNNNYNDGDGKDMLVRPQAPGKLNGFNFLDLGPYNVFKDEKTGAIFSNDTAQGTHYAGSALALTNVAEGAAAQCDATSGVKMTGNIASDGGAIASNGTIVFGQESDVYQAITTLKLKKLWSESVPNEPIQLKLYAEVNGEKVELPGYTTTLNGTADSFVEVDAEDEGALGEDQYNENSSLWETEPWVGEMGLPMSVVTKDGTVPLFTFDVNNTPDNPDDDLDPTNLADLKTIYQKVEAGELTAANAKVGDWKLVIEETIGGKVKEDFIYLENGKVEELIAHEGDVTEFKDLAGHVVGKFGVYPVEMGFSTTIANDLTPPVTEKYVNQDVHSDIVNFDQEFTYDVMAYVPMDATKVTITDTLVKGLEFADADGKATTDVSKAVQSVVVKATNDHKPGGTVAQTSDTRLNLNVENSDDPEKTNPATIDGSTLTVTIDREQGLSAARGKWIQVTFKARIQDKYRSLEELKKLAEGDVNSWRPVKKAENAPVLANYWHEGMANKATYIAYTPKNEGGATYETNTVTVKPATTKLNVEKRWNVNGSTEWPDEIDTVTFGVFQVKDGQPTPVMVDADGKVVAPDTAGAQPLTIDLHEGKTSDTVTDLPKLKKDPTCEPSKEKPCESIEYVAKEIAVNGEPVSGDASATAGYVQVSDLLKFIVNTVKQVVNDVDTFITTNETAQVEKYVNQDVHSDIGAFDQEFTYDVMAYVPAGATKITITDTLIEGLEFADANGNSLSDELSATAKAKATIQQIAIKSTNDHTPKGSVAADAEGTLSLNNQTLKVEGNTLTVTIDKATPMNRIKGKWVQVTFKARIMDNYRTIEALEGLAGWKTIPRNQNAPVLSDKEHTGMSNKADYKVYAPGNEGGSDYETNTVTVKPGTVKVTAEKTWLDEDGKKADWPTEDVAEVTVNVLGANDAVVATLTLNKDNPKATSEELPKLKGVEYGVEEVTIPGYTQVGSVTGSGTEDDPYIFTNKKNGGPQIEKYVNNDVHQNLVEFDKAIKYDIMAFVPEDADEIVIKDTLVNALEFADKNGKASTDAAAVVTSVVAKATNDHTVNGTVASTDGTPLGAAAAVALDGKKLTVTVKDATAYRGQWIQVTFYAKYTQEMIDAAKVGDSKKISGNGAVLGGAKTHTGTTNDSSYDIRVGNEWTKDVKSNTVTVEAEKIQLKATKEWKNPVGADLGEWPEGAKVTFALMKNGKQIATRTLSSSGTVTFPVQPKLTGVTYTVIEKSVTGVDALQDGDAAVENNVWTFTNKLKPDTPRIEKYVNKDVHQEVTLDEVFTYDIIAYATTDATKLTITDELIKNLEFADGDVIVEDIGAVNNHKTNGTYTGTNDDASVSATGTPVGATVTVSGKKLEVVIDGDDAKAVRGHYVRVTFRAKLTADAEYVTIAGTKNGPVLSNKEHTGVDNTASYVVEGQNGYKYDELESNTVTVKPNEPEIEKYVNQAVHKDITLDEVFTYDLIAWVTNDANTVAITDELMGDLAFASEAGDVKVEALGADDNHKVVNNVAGVVIEGNKDATVAAAGTKVDGAKVTINGQTLTVTIADATALRGQWVRVTFDAKIAEGKTLNDVKAHYEAIDAAAAGNRAEPNVGNAPVLSGENHSGLPNTTSYEIGVKQAVLDDRGNPTFDENGNVVEKTTTKYSDESNTVTVKPKHEIEFSKWQFGIKTFEIKGAEIVIRDAKGNEVESWTSTDEVHKFYLAEGKYTFEETNVREGLGKINTIVEFTVDENGKVTLSKAYENINGRVTVVDLNHLILEDMPNNITKSGMLIAFAKVDEKGAALSGAKLQLTDKAGNVLDEWTTDGTEHVYEGILPGTYVLTETAAPNGYALADPITFEVTDAGEVIVNGKQKLDVPVVTMTDKVDTGKTPGPKDSKSATPDVKTRPLVNTGASAVIPLLGALLLMGAGIVVLAIRRRRS